MLIGAHVPTEGALAAARELGAECLQMFLGDPQSFKAPPLPPEAEELAASGLPVYIHAPYRLNVASPNNRIRIPARKLLAQTLARAEEIGAAGVIVHGGHAEDGVERGFMRWRKVFEEATSKVPIVLENTAGGDNAMTRHVDALAGLWEFLGDFEPFFCFDTCHAHAAGENLEDVVKRTLEVTGRIDVVHANNSRDEFGSGRDRHANFDAGRIHAEDIVAMTAQADAPAVICETAWPGIADDLAVLRSWLRAEKQP